VSRDHFGNNGSFRAVIKMEFFGASGPDPLKPSIFELIAQEQLQDLLQPVLKYVLAVRPSCLLWRSA